MLKKILTVKNVGRFRNSATVVNPELGKHTFIVGANGFGKTTICSVLRSLKTGDTSHVLGRKTLGAVEDPCIELRFTSGVIRFDGTRWSTRYPNIAIFDGVFVAENIHSGEVVDIEHKRNLYRVIIGDEGVRLAEEDATLAAESRAKTSEISTAAKAIQPYVPPGMNLEAFMALPAVEDLDGRITQLERSLVALREADTIKYRAGLSEFLLPTLPADFAALLARTIEDVAHDAERTVSGHLFEHGMGEDNRSWIAKGLSHTDTDTCPFCGQSITGISIISAYRAVFSDGYKKLKADIEATRKQIEWSFGDTALAHLGTQYEQHKNGVEFWHRYCVFDPGTLSLPPDTLTATKEIGKAALALLNCKDRDPLKPVALDSTFTDPLAHYEQTQASIRTTNEAVRHVNTLVAAMKSEASACDAKTAETELVHLTTLKSRHSEMVSALCAEYARLNRDKDEIERKKTAIRTQLDDHTSHVVKPYERRINEYLDNFNAGFAITETKHGYPGGVATSTYQLVINRTAIDVGDRKTPTGKPSFKNTLSAGDRTTLALAFFLTSLEHDENLADKIVVFDDPFNSQDAFRRRQTVHEIMRIAGKCAQIIVLSHDAKFLKQVWDKALGKPRVTLALVDQRSQGIKITLGDLEKACQGRTANDIDDLLTFLHTGTGGTTDIIRKMRVILETYCKTTYPACFRADDWLGEIVRKIRDECGDQHPAFALYDELDQINDYTKQYHHGEDFTNTTPDDIDTNELTGFVKRTLRIVNALQA